MPTRQGKTIRFEEPPAILSAAAVGGKKESEGPCGGMLDRVFEDAMCGKDSWEQAESELQKAAFSLALEKAGLSVSELDLLFAGDLQSQCTGSSSAASNLLLPFVGLYGACSTMAESLAAAACFVGGGLASRCAAMTSSHFCAAERQFRFPLEYGSQRTPSSQWTATAAGAMVLGKGQDVPPEKPCPRVRAVTFGRIVDFGVKDVNNMGGAMAPAAADTIRQYFTDTGASPYDFDLILTGDLGAVGSTLLYTLLKEQGLLLGERHDDCGLRLYDRTGQQTDAGGSGCGCSAAVLCADILPMLTDGRLKRVLFIATGALLSLTSAQQKQTIPGIAHLVELEGCVL